MVTSTELIQRWRSKRRTILGRLLDTLPTVERAYFRQLGELIKGEKEKSQSQYRAASKRTSLVIRKDKLVEFLQVNGLSSRSEILAKTGIPSGSLGALLRDGDEFVRHERGMWALNNKRNIE